IVGCIGQQRSGKTCFAYKLCRYFKNKQPGLRVYTNLYTTDRDFTYVNSLRELPLDLEPKVILLDEIYNGTDAQDYKKLKEISIFINTIGKQNCLFIWTAIDETMVYNRIRNQTEYFILAKGDSHNIYYRLLNATNNTFRDVVCQKTPEFFKDVHYDSSFIPLDFDWDMTSWKDKLQRFYRDNYNMNIKI
ncbi:MAG: hypothetical protein K6C97_12570, partial [Treponema sp.]|nr:hypothetical protein [Treponema sp.]